MQDQLRALISRHCTWLSSQVADIASALSGLSDDPRAIRLAIELTHQITGTSGSMGFAGVSEQAGALENHLLDLEQQEGLPDGQQCAQILALFSALETASADLQPEMSSLFNADLSALNRARSLD